MGWRDRLATESQGLVSPRDDLPSRAPRTTDHLAMPIRILLVEDEAELADFVIRGLRF